MRSSCDAVATNARRACSCSRSRACMVLNARPRSPDLVARGVRGQFGVEAVVGEHQGRVAEPPQAPQHRRRDPQPQEERHRQAHQGRGGQGAPDHPRAHLRVVERLTQCEHVGLVVDRQTEGPGGPRPATTREPSRRRSPSTSPRAARTSSNSTGRRGWVSITFDPVPSNSSTRAPVRRSSASTRRSSRADVGADIALVEVGERRTGCDRSGPQRALLLLAQVALERRQERGGGHPEHHRAREDQRRNYPAAKPEDRQAAHGSDRVQPVTRAADRDDQARRLRLLLELLAQVAHVHVDRARVAVRAVAPDRAQQLLAAEQAAGLAHQGVEQLELREREAARARPPR